MGVLNAEMVLESRLDKACLSVLIGLHRGKSHPHRAWAHPRHICAETGLTPATSAPGLGSPPPHLRRDWAHPCHICTGTGFTPATSAPGLAHCPMPIRKKDWWAYMIGSEGSRWYPEHYVLLAPVLALVHRA